LSAQGQEACSVPAKPNQQAKTAAATELMCTMLLLIGQLICEFSHTAAAGLGNAAACDQLRCLRCCTSLPIPFGPHCTRYTSC
jgi:hypothetical protein